jgi:class 3 adenylate cyclase
VPQLSPTEHRTIVVVDVADFTNPDRDVADLMAVQEGVYDVLKTAFFESGIDFGSCDREDRGDGALILVPPEVSKSELADRLPDRLVAALRRYNSTRVASARFKLRIGIHAGDIRKNANGWVGHAVNLACRILEASEVKSALADSAGVMALVASDHFYTEVIQQDPGTAPEAYRRIQASVKTFSGPIWLRLTGEVAVTVRQVESEPEPDPSSLPAWGGPTHSVLGVIPPEELDVLHRRLAEVEVPHLAMLASQAAGPAIPLPRGGSVWDLFRYLSDFNAGPDGVPPALAFLSRLAGEVGGEFDTMISAWIDQQARRLRLGPAMEKRQLAAQPIPDEPHLYLMIVLEPDAIDPDLCMLSFWRQDDPLVWPPTRGGIREVAVDELEYRVDEVILDAERVWADQALSVVVEFVLARTMLGLPIHRWRKEHESGAPRPLALDYQLCVRSLERMRNTYWHRAWHMRWNSMVTNSGVDRVYPLGPTQVRHRPIDLVLSDPQWVGLVLEEPPSAQPQAGVDDVLTAALRAGLPLIFWHPTAGPEELRDLVNWLLSGDRGYADLLRRRKVADLSTPLPAKDDLVGELVVMSEDPGRIVFLDQPPATAR